MMMIEDARAIRSLSGALVLLMALFLFGTTAVAAAPGLMTFEEFGRLTSREQAVYIENMRQIVIGWDRENPGTRFVRRPMEPWLLLLERAWAAPGGICIYAGHVSRYNAQDRCVRPSEIMGRSWKITTPDGKTVEQKLCGGSGQILCNPLIFGFGKYDAGSGSYSGMCVSSVETATADCEKKYQELPNYKAQQVANQLAASNLAAEFNTMSTQVSEYCKGLAADHRQVPLCEVAKKRTDFLRERVARSAAAPRQSLLKTLPTATGSAEEVVRPGGQPVVKPGEQPVAAVESAEKPPRKAGDDPEKPCDCNADKGGATIPVVKAAKDLTAIQENLCKPEPSATPKPGQSTPVTSKTYGLFGLLGGAMNDLMQEAQGKLEAARKTTGGCPGGCRRKNAPRISVDTQPTGLAPVPSCPANFKPITFTSAEIRQIAPGVGVAGSALTRRFQGSGEACNEGLKKWMQETLKGDSPLGEQVNSVKCPTECGLSNTLELTSAGGGGRCDLDVRWTVKCGPPKADREWKSSVVLVQDWSCEPEGGK